MFFNSWADLIRTVVVGTLAYIALIALLRVSGKRTLTKMNAFDLVVTVALGSTLATILLSEQVALAQGMLAFALLIFLQYSITWLLVRFSAVGRLVKAEPSLLFYQGQFLSGTMKRERITESKVRATARAQGLASLEEVEAVVLETDGSVSVIKRTDRPDTSALSEVIERSQAAGK